MTKDEANKILYKLMHERNIKVEQVLDKAIQEGIILGLDGAKHLYEDIDKEYIAKMKAVYEQIDKDDTNA